MFRHILVPLDGSLRAKGTIPIAARIALGCSGTTIFVRIIQDVSEDAALDLRPFKARRELMAKRARVE